jgi:uncharacterized membrane protein YqjE
MTIPDAAAASREPGMARGWKGLLADLSALFRNRIELAALEIAEARASLLKALAIVLVAALAIWFAIAFWSVLLVFLAWPVLKWKILLIMAAVFTVGGCAALYRANRILRHIDFLASTRAEVRKDFDILRK